MNPSQLNFDALLAFSVFTESMNFSTAARQLHISQPSLHIKIRKLGEQLDKTLYLRAGRSLELTPHGEAVARFARQTQRATEQFASEFNGKLNSQSVVLAAGEGAYLYLLSEGIKHFQQHTSTPLRLLSTNREQTIEAVLSGKAQLGVAPLEIIPEQLQSKLLATVGQVLVVPNNHRLAGRSRLKLKDLAGERMIVPPANRPHRQMLASLLQSESVAWEIAVEANGWELMLSLAAMGAGVAVVNACCRLPKGLVAIPIVELPSLHYHCFHLRSIDSATASLKKTMLRYADSWKIGR